MAINVALKNPRTGEIKFIKVGFSWVLFFFSTVLGIPLFARKLYRWGFALLAINIASLVFPMIMSRSGAVLNHIMMFGGQIILMIYLGIKGNEITAKHWLEKGWRFVEPQSDAARYAKMQWKIHDGIAHEPSENARSTAVPPLS